MNYHVLNIVGRDKARVVFHIPVPAETNGAGVELKTALSQYRVGETVVPWLQASNPTEYAKIQSGEVYEHVEVVTYDANASNAEKRDEIDARYTALVPVVQDRIREELRFWGLDRDVS